MQAQAPRRTQAVLRGGTARQNDGLWRLGARVEAAPGVNHHLVHCGCLKELSAGAEQQIDSNFAQRPLHRSVCELHHPVGRKASVYAK